MPIGASRQVGHWKISGCLRDGCRLVHPIRRFIIHIFNSHLRRIPFNESRLYYYSRSFGFRKSHFNSIIIFVLSFQRYTQSMYLFHKLIHIHISYAHSYTHSHTPSCAHFKYSCTYSFMYSHSCILIHNFIYVYSFMHSFTHSFMYTHS